MTTETTIDSNAESATTHPADAIDVGTAAATVAAWLLGEGPHWDPFIRDNRPAMQCPASTLEYTMEGIVDHAFHTRGVDLDGVEPHSPQGRAEVADWCLDRARTAKRTLCTLPVTGTGMRAHRLVGAAPEDLRADLGIFWTHSLHETVDIYAMWAEGGREAATLCIEATIPLEAVDWQVSCMALMDWYLGDSEQELRVLPGHRVVVASCTRWNPPEDWLPDTPVTLPDLEWRT